MSATQRDSCVEWPGGRRPIIASRRIRCIGRGNCQFVTTKGPSTGRRDDVPIITTIIRLGCNCGNCIRSVRSVLVWPENGNQWELHFEYHLHDKEDLRFWVAIQVPPQIGGKFLV
ncbi:hypothetical protein Pelo_6506 [Pelomyxa schiedti]|nr:hypothetical protein Pelo_6506 [Pelomyxa schiedti]